MSTNQGPDPAPIPAAYTPPTLVSTLPHHVRVQAAQKALAEFAKHVHLGPKLFAEWEREAEAELDAALAASNALDQPQMDAERERQFEIAERQEVARLLALQEASRAVSRDKVQRFRERAPKVDPADKAEQNRKYREKLKARKAP